MIRTVIVVSFAGAVIITAASGNPIAGLVGGFGIGLIVTAIWAMWR